MVRLRVALLTLATAAACSGNGSGPTTPNPGSGSVASGNQTDRMCGRRDENMSAGRLAEKKASSMRWRRKSDAHFA